MYEEPKAGNRFPAAPATPMQDSVTKNIMSEFSYSQLPHNQAVIARPFCELAWKMHEELPKGPSKTECLRSLRNAMQSAIRAEVNGQPATSET